MSQILEGRSAIVTGAASPHGLGLASAKMLAEHGARVLITDLDAAAAEAAARTLPGRGHFGARCNVTDKADCEAAAALAVTHFGRIDVLVNIAGITNPQRLMEVTPEMYSLVMDVNMRGTLYMTQAVVPTMRKQQAGSIVNMSSVAAQRGGGVFGGSHYAASKAAILGYTKAAARELGPELHRHRHRERPDDARAPRRDPPERADGPPRPCPRGGRLRGLSRLRPVELRHRQRGRRQWRFAHPLKVCA
jgi:NAD(P)-dependent dehydrogenase (short-subunit alcohol dehydrogenase family)